MSLRDRIARMLHGLGVLALAGLIVIPALPWSIPGRRALVDALAKVSISQHWKMYAPNPSRSHAFMNIEAEDQDGTRVQLQETAQERDGWSRAQAFWTKTRIDIWRAYANFTPKHRSHNRIWYLRGVCVREARTGEIPDKLVMYRVERRFTPPDRVRAGAPVLGPRKRSLVTVQYCRAPHIMAMIEADRARREGE